MGTNKVLGGGGFHHVAMKVHDFEGAVKFYTEVLGLREKLAWGEGDKRAVLLDTGDGSCLELFPGGPATPKPEGPILHFALNTTNCDAVLERARKAGAKVTMESTTIDLDSRPAKARIRIAFCQGPAGELIEFFQVCSS
jgi:glyoxylase I family protein